MTNAVFRIYLIGFFCFTSSIIIAQTTEERSALERIYHALDGPNWTNSWDLEGDPSGWHGLTFSWNGELIGLNLYENNLKGVIPEEINQLTSLKYLHLGSNQLVDSVPTLSGLIGLESLNLSRNELSGSLHFISELISLMDLDLRANEFSGSIPKAIGNLSILEALYLSGNNLTGSIPLEIGLMSNLSYLTLASNDLEGEVPAEIGDLSKLRGLLLNGNELSGMIPKEIGNLYELDYLHLADNKLGGAIPSSIGNLNKLEFVDISNNQISGPLPESLGNLQLLSQFSLQNNLISGSLPLGICKLQNLRTLYFDYNELEGAVPACFKDLDKLTQFTIFDNFLTDLPDLTGMESLEYAFLNWNLFDFEDFELNQSILGSDYYIEQKPFGNSDTIETAYNETVRLSFDVGGEHNYYYWFRDSVEVAFTSDPSYSFQVKSLDDLGVYWLQVENQLLSGRLHSKPVTITSTALTSMEESESVMVVYPNPSHGFFKIKLGSVYQNADIEVTDLSGKKLSSDITRYSPGEYLCRIDTDFSGLLTVKITNIGKAPVVRKIWIK
jgi:Leucine-rich repeat (LRR) protein